MNTEIVIDDKSLYESGNNNFIQNYKANDNISKTNLLSEKNNFCNNFHKSFSSYNLNSNIIIKNKDKFNNNCDLINTKAHINSKKDLFVSSIKSNIKNIKYNNENDYSFANIIKKKENKTDNIFNFPLDNEKNTNIDLLNAKEGIKKVEEDFYSNFYEKNKFLKVEDVSFEKEFKKLNKEIIKLKKENKSLINKLQKAQKYNEFSLLKLDEQQKEIITLKNKLLKLSDNINQKNDNISSLKENINHYNVLNNEKEKDIQLLNSKLLSLEKDVKNNKNVFELLHNEQIKNQNLKEEIISIKRFDEKSEQLLQILFKFYNNIKNLIYFIPNQNLKRKEVLNDVIKFEKIDEFESKLNQLFKKCEKIVEEARLRIGKYFPCDITCCATQNERIKYFQKNFYSKKKFN